MQFIDLLELIINAFFAMIPCQRPTPSSWDKFKIIAHRGAHNQHCKENTMAAFHHAVELGAWGIELDIQYTKDNIPVVNHDPNLKRSFNIEKKVNDLPLKQLREIAPLMPTLNEVVTTFGHRLHLFIELKAEPPKPDLFIQELKPLTAGNDYHIISQNKNFFKGLECISAKHKLLVSLVNTAKIVEESLATPLGGVLGSYMFLNSSYRDSLKKSKQKVGVGQVNSTFNLYRAINRDIEWIYTNKADKVIPLFKKLQSS